jgi:hypothetical protein
VSEIAAAFALAIRGVGPYCLVVRTPGTRVWQDATALCGESVLVCNDGGGLRRWEPPGDPVCADCLNAHHRSMSPRSAPSVATTEPEAPGPVPTPTTSRQGVAP